MITLKGFHLIEMLITLTIAGILANFGTLAYTQYLTQEARLEAAHSLSKLALAMEQYALEQRSYQGANLSTLHFLESIARNHYRLKIYVATPYRYQLSAIPQGKQAQQDRACGTLSLSSNGEKKISGTGKLGECWG